MDVITLIPDTFRDHKIWHKEKFVLQPLTALAGTEPCDLSSSEAEKENTKQSKLFFLQKEEKMMVLMTSHIPVGAQKHY